MVRGPAALLGGTLYLLLAGVLPDASAVVAACAGTVAVALCALAAVPGREGAAAMVTLGLGSALLAVALNGRDVASGASPVEALFGAAAGLLFASGFALPAVVVALPLVVGGIDASSLLGGAERVPGPGTDPDLLTLDLPAWGGGDPVAAVGLLDATFLALFAAWSLRFDLRPRVAIPLMVCLLTVVIGVGTGIDRALPTLPALALGFLMPAAGRLPALLRNGG